MSEEIRQDALEPIEPSEAAADISFSFESHYEDILLAAKVIDHKNRVETRRNVQTMGLLLILWMFVPDLLKDPSQIMGWVMVVLSVLLGAAIWKMPERNNRKFAAAKAAASPSVSMTFDETGFTVAGTDGATVSYADVRGIYDYKDILVVSYNRNHVLTIPKIQLDADTLSALFTLLGERREEVAPFRESIGKNSSAK